MYFHDLGYGYCFWIKIKVKLVVEGDLHNARISIAVSM